MQTNCWTIIELWVSLYDWMTSTKSLDFSRVLTDRLNEKILVTEQNEETRSNVSTFSGTKHRWFTSQSNPPTNSFATVTKTCLQHSIPIQSRHQARSRNLWKWESIFKMKNIFNNARRLGWPRRSLIKCLRNVFSYLQENAGSQFSQSGELRSKPVIWMRDYWTILCSSATTTQWTDPTYARHGLETRHITFSTRA